MKDKTFQPSVRFVFVSAIVLAVAGCGGSEPLAEGGSEYARIRAMSNLYAGYLAAHKNQPPADEKTFRAFLNTKQTEIEKAGLTIDDIFISPRTGEPLQWVYGKKPVTGRAGMQYIGYESAPVDDKRLVIATRGMYELMDDADFRTFFPNSP